MRLFKKMIGAWVLAGTFVTISASQASHPGELVRAAGSSPAAAEARTACEPSAGSFYPGRLLVRFKAHTTRTSREVIHEVAGAERVLRDYHVVGGLQLVRVPEEGHAHALAVYAKQPDVLYAEPDFIVYADAIPNDTYMDQLWGLHNTGQTVNDDPGTPGADIRAAEAWDVWTGDPEFRIAVIDTGVKYNHPDLRANIWTNPDEIPDNGLDDDGNGYVDDIHGYDFYDDDGDPTDGQTHGTHVAGTIGAVGDNSRGVVGVNWQCKVVALRFLGSG